jgi:molecular chaperone HtpG
LNGTDATLKLKHLNIGEAKVEYGNPIIEVKIDKEKNFTLSIKESV